MRSKSCQLAPCLLATKSCCQFTLVLPCQTWSVIFLLGGSETFRLVIGYLSWRQSNSHILLHHSILFSVSCFGRSFCGLDRYQIYLCTCGCSFQNWWPSLLCLRVSGCKLCGSHHCLAKASMSSCIWCICGCRQSPQLPHPHRAFSVCSQQPLHTSTASKWTTSQWYCSSLSTCSTLCSLPSYSLHCIWNVCHSWGCCRDCTS